MLSKKSMFFLSTIFFGANYSAESPVDEVFGIEIKDSAMLEKIIDEKSGEKRVFVVLHWPGEGLSFCRKEINGNKRLLDVYFWEHIPRALEEDVNREEFTTRYVKGYFYPSSFKLVIFPRISMFSAHCGVAVLNENDTLEYAAFSNIINQVLISILRKEFFYKRIFYFGEKILIKYLKKEEIYNALEDDYREWYSPVKDFSNHVLGSPPRPLPLLSPERTKSDGLNPRLPGNSHGLGVTQSPLNLLRLHGPNDGLRFRPFLEIKTS